VFPVAATEPAFEQLVQVFGVPVNKKNPAKQVVGAVAPEQVAAFPVQAVHEVVP
jgi:hypothetical protein